MEIFATYEKFCTEVPMCCDSRKLQIRYRCCDFSVLMLESRFIGSFLSRNQFGNRANDAVALLPSLCLSLVIHAIPCVFISFKGHDRNFRNKEEKEIQFDTFSFSHTLYTSPFTFLFFLVIFYISIFHDKTRSDECNTPSRECGPT